jgi:magnesium transporter
VTEELVEHDLAARAGTHAAPRHAPLPGGDPLLAETAARHLVRHVPTGTTDETVGAVIARLQSAAYEYAGAIHVLDAGRRLAGIVPIETLLNAAPGARLADLALHEPAAVSADTDQEHVASFALRHGVASVPVVDRDGRLLGVVPPRSLLEVLRHEHVEDLHRLAGIRREGARARTALEAPPQRRARDRLPWLLVGLFGSALATWVVAGFERALSTNVAIAFFVPGLVYLADAIGTQTEAIAVRGLSLSRAPMAHLIGGELRTGALIGLTLSLLAFPAIWLVFDSARLAAAVALSLLAAASVATTVGLALPWLLARLGRDPAFGSGPLATIVQDVLTLLIYFGFASLLL